MTDTELVSLRSAPCPETGNRLAIAFDITRRSQADCVRETRFTPQYVSDMVRGRFQNISVENARVFAEWFGCYIEDLFPGNCESSDGQPGLPFSARKATA